MSTKLTRLTRSGQPRCQEMLMRHNGWSYGQCDYGAKYDIIEGEGPTHCKVHSKDRKAEVGRKAAERYDRQQAVRMAPHRRIEHLENAMRKAIKAYTHDEGSEAMMDILYKALEKEA